MQPINHLQFPSSMPPLNGPAGAEQGQDPSFKAMMLDSIQQVNSMQLEADQAVEQMFTGGEVNPAEVMTAVQKADLAFRLTMQMRNKMMDVYHEIRDIRI